MDFYMQYLNYSSDDSSEEENWMSQRKKSLLNHLIGILLEHISKFSSKHGHVIDMLERLDVIGTPVGYISKLIKDDYTIRNSFQPLVSLGQELKVFFTVPNQQIMSNMVEAILCFQADSIARVKGSIQNLWTEFGFLITFLGDTAMHLQPTKNIVIDIESMVNEVGRFLYSFFFTIVLFVITREKGISHPITDFEAVVNEIGSLLHNNFFGLLENIPPFQTTTEVEGNKKKGKKVEETKNPMMDIKALVHEVESFLKPFIFTGNGQGPEGRILDLAISDLLTKFELLKTKIKEHYVAVLKMRSDVDPKTAVLSPFIVDSILDDLVYAVNNMSEKIIGVEDQIVMLHKELMSLGSCH